MSGFFKIGYLGELKIISYNQKSIEIFLKEIDFDLPNIKRIKQKYVNSVGIDVRLDLELVGLEIDKKKNPVSVVFISKRTDRYLFADKKHLLWKIIKKDYP